MRGIFGELDSALLSQNYHPLIASEPCLTFDGPHGKAGVIWSHDGMRVQLLHNVNSPAPDLKSVTCTMPPVPDTEETGSLFGKSTAWVNVIENTNSMVFAFIVIAPTLGLAIRLVCAFSDTDSGDQAGLEVSPYVSHIGGWQSLLILTRDTSSASSASASISQGPSWRRRTRVSSLIWTTVHKLALFRPCTGSTATAGIGTRRRRQTSRIRRASLARRRRREDGGWKRHPGRRSARGDPIFSSLSAIDSSRHSMCTEV
jgi:hypothetical protein